MGVTLDGFEALWKHWLCVVNGMEAFALCRRRHGGIVSIGMDALTFQNWLCVVAGFPALA
jgi:hypothetical protein